MAAVVADDAAVLTLSGARGHQGTLGEGKARSCQSSCLVCLVLPYTQYYFFLYDKPLFARR